MELPRNGTGSARDGCGVVDDQWSLGKVDRDLARVGGIDRTSHDAKGAAGVDLRATTHVHAVGVNHENGSVVCAAGVDGAIDLRSCALQVDIDYGLIGASGVIEVDGAAIVDIESSPVDHRNTWRCDALRGEINLGCVGIAGVDCAASERARQAENTTRRTIGKSSG